MTNALPSISFAVDGMSCASCVKRVELAAAAIPGVREASVNLASETLTVRAEDGFSAASLVAAVEKAGYAVPRRTVEIAVEGMSCASCVGRVERALAAAPGVLNASVNLATERATVEIAGDGTQLGPLTEAVRSAGYTARPVGGADTGETREAAKAEEARVLKRDVIVAAVLTLPLFVLEMGRHLFPPLHHWLAAAVSPQLLHVAFFVLTTMILFGPGRRFLSKGFPALLRGAPDMNSLVALGTTAAYGYSTFVTFAPELLPEAARNVYFEAAAVIVTLILFGRLLEARAKGQAGQAIKRLVGLQAKSAHVLRDGAVVDVPLEQVVAGDVVLVKPGEKVPVDGEVIDGSSYVDEAMISGEPVPVAKAEGATVVGGTINKTGSFRFRATRVGGDTMLAQIIRMVERAQGAKLPIQLLVDQVTMRFVPVIMAIAVVTFLVWLVWGPDPAFTFAMVNAVAVLIIACPCAMGLATPTSIMVGTGRGAELGILFRKGEALQMLRSADIVAMDKTGTLTLGRPSLTDFEVRDGLSQDEALALVAAVEATSEHPLAHAIVEAAEARGLAIAAADDFEAVPGNGVRARVGGRLVEVGASRFMARLGYDASAFAEGAEQLAGEGKTPVLVAVDGAVVASLAVADPIKPTTREAVAELHRQGIEVAMITGDNQRTAQAIARQLGIDRVVAEVLPDGKVDAVAGLREGGRTVAFVGDGINDAPALAEADIGIAVGTGTDVAIESADVVLMGGDLRGVTSAIALSRATMRNIKQNLFWAFGYNVLLIPVAAGVLYPSFGILLSPIFAAAAMALSSVFVVGNALRLRRFAVARRGGAAEGEQTAALSAANA